MYSQFAMIGNAFPVQLVGRNAKAGGEFSV